MITDNKSISIEPMNVPETGFDKITSQVHSRSIIKGFQLNILFIGAKGCGKSTFLNNLFHTKVPEKSSTDSVTDGISFLLIENNVKLQVKVYEIRDFGNKINKCYRWKGIGHFLDKCFQKQLEQEDKINRTNDLFQDHLVHLCLYFIQPSCESYCLKNLDVEFMKSIHNKVNLVPLIAKADSLTAHEIQLHKKNLRTELNNNGINYFKFVLPEDSGWRPDATNFKYPERTFLQNLIERFPFAVAAGNETKTFKNKQETVRTYPWGSVQIDNLAHCDTLVVRTLVLSTHLQELIDQTHFIFYEKYRVRYINELCFQLGISEDNDIHPALYLERYFFNENHELLQTVKDLEKKFQDSVTKKQDTFHRRSKDIEFESLKLTQELQYLYSTYDKDLEYFIADRSRWNCDNLDRQEVYGTITVNKQGRIKGAIKIKK